MRLSTVQVLYLYFTAFVTGFSILIVEILGTQIISPFFGASIFSWSSLITVTLGMLAVGYAFGGWLADRYISYQLYFFIIILSGVTVSLVMKLDQPVLLFSDSYGHIYGPLVSATLLFSLPLFLLGLISPLTLKLRVSQIGSLGLGVGSVYACSTIGSVAGAVLSGFYLQTQYTLLVIFNGISFLLVFTAVLGVLIFIRGLTFRPLFFALPFLAVLFFPKIEAKTEEHSKIVERYKSHYGDVIVVDNVTDESTYRCLISTSGVESCIDQTRDEVVWSYIEEMIRIAKLEKEQSSKPYLEVLCIGVGAGDLIRHIMAFSKVDAVEINPKTIIAAREHFDFEENDNVNIIERNARYFLRKTSKKYDLILATAYSEDLFTAENFQLVKSRLSDGGLALQLLEAKSGDESMMAMSVFKTSRQVFPEAVFTAPAIYRFKNKLVDAIVHLPANKSYRANFSDSLYKRFEVDTEAALILTDNFNPYHFLITGEVRLVRDYVLDVGGHASLFRR